MREEYVTVDTANRQARADELAAVSSIFPEFVRVEDDGKVSLNFSEPIDVRLTVSFPSGYPNNNPPLYVLSGPELSSQERRLLKQQLDEAAEENRGQPLLFTWTNVLNEFLQNLTTSNDEKEGEYLEDPQSAMNFERLENEEAPNSSQQSSNSSTGSFNAKKHTIHHGQSITDRKSHFQAHLAVIKSEAEAHEVLSQLLENGKIARATHNIYAWRVIETRKGHEILLQDCEDDGETKAASKILEIMIRLGAVNVIVIVSRWYGGIHLGPDRFKHINNLARELLIEQGFDKKNAK